MWEWEAATLCKFNSFSFVNFSSDKASSIAEIEEQTNSISNH